jgi:hypothetical protein
VSANHHDRVYVAKVIGKTPNWVLRHAHELPHSRAGQTYFWTDADIADLLDHLKVRPSAARPNGPRPITGQRRTA